MITDGGGWTLVANQKAGFETSIYEGQNENNPNTKIEYFLNKDYFYSNTNFDEVMILNQETNDKITEIFSNESWKNSDGSYAGRYIKDERLLTNNNYFVFGYSSAETQNGFCIHNSNYYGCDGDSNQIEGIGLFSYYAYNEFSNCGSGFYGWKKTYGGNTADNCYSKTNSPFFSVYFR